MCFFQTDPEQTLDHKCKAFKFRMQLWADILKLQNVTQLITNSLLKEYST